jgi:signal peptidase I
MASVSTVNPSTASQPKINYWVLGVKIALRDCALLLFVCLLFLVYGLLPNRWYRVLYVYSGSMSPAIQAGDLLVVTPPPAQLKAGMVLTLRVNGNLVTHRLLAVKPDGSLLTQGDANNTPDDWQEGKVEVIGQVRAIIPYLGYLANLRSGLNLPSTGSWYSSQQNIGLDLEAGDWITPTLTLTPTPTFTPTAPLDLTSTATPLPTGAPDLAETPTSMPEPAFTSTPVPPLPSAAPTDLPPEATRTPEALPTLAPPSEELPTLAPVDVPEQPQDLPTGAPPLAPAAP